MPASTFVVSQPPDASVQIWRYMDVAKYVALLDTRALHLAAADRLGDPYEGSFPRPTVDYRRKHLRGWGPGGSKRLSDIFRKFCRHTFINCWHMNQGESAAMWRLYARTEDAVAVRSTYSVLRDAVRSNCHLGVVAYVDYETGIVPDHSTYMPYMYKRRSFEHEREVRLIVQRPPRAKSRRRTKQRAMDLSLPSPPGILIKIDLQTVIQDVRVAPNAATWFLNTVRSVSHRYGLRVEPKRSALEGDPVY